MFDYRGFQSYKVHDFRVQEAVTIDEIIGRVNQIFGDPFSLRSLKFTLHFRRPFFRLEDIKIH